MAPGKLAPPATSSARPLIPANGAANPMRSGRGGKERQLNVRLAAWRRKARPIQQMQNKDLTTDAHRCTRILKSECSIGVVMLFLLPFPESPPAPTPAEASQNLQVRAAPVGLEPGHNPTQSTSSWLFQQAIPRTA